MSNGAAQIRVSGLAKRYGALEVFRGIDFDVGEREIVAIVNEAARGLPLGGGQDPLDDGMPGG